MTHELAAGNAIASDELWDDHYDSDRAIRLARPFSQLWGRTTPLDACCGELLAEDQYWTEHATLAAPPADPPARLRMFSEAAAAGRLMPPEKWALPILPPAWHKPPAGSTGSPHLTATICWIVAALMLFACGGAFGPALQRFSLLILAVPVAILLTELFNARRRNRSVRRTLRDVTHGVADIFTAGSSAERRSQECFDAWRESAEHEARQDGAEIVARRLVTIFPELLHDSNVRFPWFATLADLFDQQAERAPAGHADAARFAREQAAYWRFVESTRGLPSHSIAADAPPALSDSPPT